MVLTDSTIFSLKNVTSSTIVCKDTTQHHIYQYVCLLYKFLLQINLIHCSPFWSQYWVVLVVTKWEYIKFWFIHFVIHLHITAACVTSLLNNTTTYLVSFNDYSVDSTYEDHILACFLSSITGLVTKINIGWLSLTFIS